MAMASSPEDVWLHILKSCINSTSPSLLPTSRENYQHLGDAMFGFRHRSMQLMLECLSETYTVEGYAYCQVRGCMRKEQGELLQLWKKYVVRLERAKIKARSKAIAR